MIDVNLKRVLGIDENEPEETTFQNLRELIKDFEKPCKVLGHCVYGPLVEQFPCFPCEREEMIAHNEQLKQILSTGISGHGKPIDEERRTLLQKMVQAFHPEDYPEKIPDLIREMACSVYGHFCPIYFTAEQFSDDTWNDLCSSIFEAYTASHKNNS